MMKNVLKGFVIGIGKIIPGVSGSMLAISMGVYERTLKIISGIRNAKFGDFIFLFTLVIGVFLGISIFSKGVKWLLSVCYLPTMLLFVGLILGGLPDIVKEMYSGGRRGIVKIKYVIIFIFSFLFSYMITRLGSGTFDISGMVDSTDVAGNIGLFGWLRNICVFLIIGFIEAFSSIVPGISGTAIFMSLGCYEILLSFYENIFNSSYFIFGIFFFAGVVIGILILARVITFLFNRYKCATYWAILGFMVASILIMIMMSFGIDSDIAIKFAYGSITLEDFIDFDRYYWLSLIRLFFCLLLIQLGYFAGSKINVLLAND